MKRVKVAQFKAELSAHLARVERGEEVIVMRRDKPVAKLVPVTNEAHSDELARLVAEGILIPPKKPWKAGRRLPMPTGPKISRKTMQEVMDWVRGED